MRNRLSYISTRGSAPALGFDDVLLAGLARDGGLYVPDAWPQMSLSDIAALRGRDYATTATRVMAPFVAGGLDEGELAGLTRDAYAGFDHAAVAPLSQIGANEWILELYHGPTLAFKDLALQLVGRMFDAVLEKRGEPHHGRRRDLGRHRFGGDRGLPGPRQCRHFHAASGRPGFRGPAPPDDHRSGLERL